MYNHTQWEDLVVWNNSQITSPPAKHMELLSFSGKHIGYVTIYVVTFILTGDNSSYHLYKFCTEASSPDQKASPGTYFESFRGISLAFVARFIFFKMFLFELQPFLFISYNNNPIHEVLI